MKLIIIMVGIFSTFSLFAEQVGTWTASPEFLRLKVYGVYASTSNDCSNLQTIFSSETAEEVNFLDAPNLGSGIIPSGTYPCVLIEMSSQITYASDADSPNGACGEGTENTLTVCQTGNTTTLADGTVNNCLDDTDVKVALYLNTIAASDGSDSHNQDVWNKPTSTTDTTKGFTLQQALVVSLEASGQFDVNGSNKVMEWNNNGTTECEFQPPLFSFSQN
ncbi:hypothetical protein N9N67_00730 [Bacteriovoracaceae bacterium]|nr:hypothetical protein [Bacteriovoracaceae bacterium]